jgi:hypothetical protein
MKTKMKLHLIIYITIVGFLTACENEIPYNPGQQDPQIIMNALLETGQAENDVYLHLGWAENVISHWCTVAYRTDIYRIYAN